MLNENAGRFLEAIGNALSENVSQITVEGDERSRSLLFEVASPFEENKLFGYDITLSEAGVGFILAEFMLIAFDGIPEEHFDELQRIITAVNVPLTLGGFNLIPEHCAIELRQGMIYGADAKSEDVAGNILGTIDLMEDTVLLFGTYIDDFLKGGKTADEVIAEAEGFGGDSL